MPSSSPAVWVLLWAMYPSDVVFEPLLSQMRAKGRSSGPPGKSLDIRNSTQCQEQGLAPKGGKQYPKGSIGQVPGCYLLSKAKAFLVQPMLSLCPGAWCWLLQARILARCQVKERVSVLWERKILLRATWDLPKKEKPIVYLTGPTCILAEWSLSQQM